MSRKWLLLVAALALASCCEKRVPQQVISRQVATLQQATDLLGQPQERRPWRDVDGQYFHPTIAAFLSARARHEKIEFHKWEFETVFGRPCEAVVAATDASGRILGLNTARSIQ
jgi:hypothetical protein